MEPEDEEDEVEIEGSGQRRCSLYQDGHHDSENDSRREDVVGSNHGNDSDSSNSNQRYRDKFIIQTLIVPGHTIKH